MLQNIMNFWKKNYKIIIIAVCVIIMIVITIVICNYKRDQTTTFLTANNDYFIVNKERNNEFNSLIFVSNNENKYLDLNNIDQVLLKDLSSSDQYEINLLNVESVTNATYEEEQYYGYDCLFNIPFLINNLVLIKTAGLEFIYKTGEKINLQIGSMCIYNYNDNANANLHYSSLKGNTKLTNNCHVLESVLVKLENSNEYQITKITPISNYVDINLKQVSIVNNDQNIQDVDNLILKGNEYLLINLNYSELIEKSVIGFIISYVEQGVTYEKIVLPFKFFNSNAKPKMIRYEHTSNYY